jgi:hypothetical protein
MTRKQNPKIYIENAITALLVEMQYKSGQTTVGSPTEPKRIITVFKLFGEIGQKSFMIKAMAS